ncbi:MoaD/ThiS family protein [Thermodesulfobacteriota bacterium]
MSIEVEVSAIFRSYFDDQGSILAEGGTVGECLQYLTEKYPSTKNMLIDDEGNLQNHFEVFLNNESIYNTGSETPVTEGDKIALIYIVHGG